MCSTSNPVTKKNYFITSTLTACHCINADSRILTLLFFLCGESKAKSTTLCYNVHMRQLSRIKFTTIVLFLLVIFIFLHFQLLIKSFFCSVYLQWGEDKNRNTLYPVYLHVNDQTCISPIIFIIQMLRRGRLVFGYLFVFFLFEWFSCECCSSFGAILISVPLIVGRMILLPSFHWFWTDDHNSVKHVKKLVKMLYVLSRAWN